MSVKFLLPTTQKPHIKTAPAPAGTALDIPKAKLISHKNTVSSSSSQLIDFSLLLQLSKMVQSLILQGIAPFITPERAGIRTPDNLIKSQRVKIIVTIEKSAYFKSF